MKVYKNLIIGGGASGLMLSANLKSKKDSIILEGNSKLGAKILVSGGGRCNFTNKEISAKDYLADSEFINYYIKKYNNRWLIDWLKNRGLEYTIKNQKEYFCKNSAKDLLNILKNESRGINIELNTKVLSVIKEKNIFKVITNRGDFFAKRVIVASGGLSFPKLGASSIGLDIAKSFGHNIVPTAPALVGFTLQPKEAFFKSLSGISVDVNIKVKDYNFFGSLLFAHRGISGPAVLNSSLFWDKGHLEIDFLPKFDFNTLKNSTKALSNTLPLPKRAVKAFLEHLNIRDLPYSKLSNNEIESLNMLKRYTFAPAGTFGYSKAEVTKGGVDTNEIDKNRLMSKKIKNLFFLGEVLNVTGRLGGFNFQWAFASAKYLANYLETNQEL